MLDLAGDLIQELIDLKAALVLPSSGVDEDKLAEVIGGVLAGQEAMHCNRVWEAWSHGTMSEDDFSLVSDDEEAVAEIVRAVVAYVRGES